MLKIDHPTKRYGGFCLDCTMEVKPGFITGFVGPNGSGKSTTLPRAIRFPSRKPIAPASNLIDSAILFGQACFGPACAFRKSHTCLNSSGPALPVHPAPADVF